MKPKSCLAGAVIGFLVLVFASRVNAECCYGNILVACDDCSIAGPFCGAYGGGGCNLFGCNCGGGCRKRDPNENYHCDKRRSARSLHIKPDLLVVPNEDGAVTGKEIVRTFDADSDGALDVVEVVIFLKRSGVAVQDDQWRALDKNQDGKLDAGEIDDDISGGEKTELPIIFSQ